MHTCLSSPQNINLFNCVRALRSYRAILIVRSCVCVWGRLSLEYFDWCLWKIKLLMSHCKDCGFAVITTWTGVTNTIWKTRSSTSPIFYYVASCQLHGNTFSNWRNPKISQLIPWLQADPTNVAQHGLSKGSTVLAPLAVPRLHGGAGGITRGSTVMAGTTTMRMRRGLESWRIYTLDL